MWGLASGCTKKKAFGLLPVGSRVAWSFTPLSDVPEGRSEPFQVGTLAEVLSQLPGPC